MIGNAKPQAASINVLPTTAPSTFAQALAQRLAQKHGVTSDVHWGNEGFCVDLALRHPARPGDVTVGVLCDSCRYTAADDPIEWDIFRTVVFSKRVLG